MEREQNKREERLRELAAATEKVKEIERKRKEKEEERDKENAWNLEIKRQEIAKAQHKLGEDLLEMIKKTDKETLEGGNMNRKHEVTKTPKEEAMKISSNEEKVHPMMDPTNLTKLQLKKAREEAYKRANTCKGKANAHDNLKRLLRVIAVSLWD